MGLKDIIIGVLLVGIFALAMITFAYQTQIDNNADNNILNEPSFKGLNNTLSDNLQIVRSDAQEQRENFETQEATGGDEGFSLTSVVSVVKKFTSMMFGTFNIITGVLSDVLGIPSIVINLIGGILIVLMVLLSWRVIKAGGT